MGKRSFRVGRVISMITVLALLLSMTAGVSSARDRRVTDITKTALAGNAKTLSVLSSSAAFSSAASSTEGNNGKSGVRSLSLEESVTMALAANPDILTVTQDVYLRKQDLEKARYFAKKIKDADRDASKGEEMLAMLKGQLAVTPEDSPMYDYLETQIEFIEKKLDEAEPYRLDKFDNVKVAYLYEKQAESGVRLTEIGEKVARQKITLLVSKQYFDAVKAGKLAEVKELALNRAKEQAKAAKASYDAGFRAKDDYLLAQAQAELMYADWQKAKLDKQTADAELKSTIGLDQSVEINLTGYTGEVVKADLSYGLDKGMSKRLEIQKAQAELEIAKLNFQLAQAYLGPGVVDYEQAKINVKKAEIELNRQKSKVQKEIYQAYRGMAAAESMEASIKSTVSLARESASIAQYRYQVGFSLPSPVMKAINSEDLAGTTVEVLAAQEKLAEVEQKVIEVNYSSNLARVNYLVSIGEGL